MAKKNHTISYTFTDTPERIKKLQAEIDKIAAQGLAGLNPGGPIEDWGQNGGWVQSPQDHWSQAGGWYLVIGDQDAIKVSTPERALTDVTQIVYTALSKAQRSS